MLVSFNVKNVYSFGMANNDFTMETGKARGKKNHVIEGRKRKVLRFSAILGANSSGKTNFVKSIALAKKIVVHGLGDDRSISQYYNRNMATNKDLPSEFNFCFKINNKIYEYSFSILLSERIFTYESLKCEEKLIFIRDFINDEFKIDIKCKDQSKSNKINVFFDTVEKINNVLFLKDMNLNKGSIYDEVDTINIFQDLYNIFSKSIKIVSPHSVVSKASLLINSMIEVEKILDILGFDVKKLSFEEDSVENVFSGFPKEVVDEIMVDINEKLNDNDATTDAIMRHVKLGLVKFSYDEDNSLKIHSIRTTHTNGSNFYVSEESDGFRRILDLIDIILSPKEGDIFVIDEIDRSLNCLLTKQFINYYLNYTNEQNTQLIITTHETRLLDLDLLRKDEIWLFDNIDGDTKITALTDYEGKIRSDVKLDVAYLDGRYGGIPKIREVSVDDEKM